MLEPGSHKFYGVPAIQSVVCLHLVLLKDADQGQGMVDIVLELVISGILAIHRSVLNDKNLFARIGHVVMLIMLRV